MSTGGNENDSSFQPNSGENAKIPGPSSHLMPHSLDSADGAYLNKKRGLSRKSGHSGSTNHKPSFMKAFRRDSPKQSFDLSERDMAQMREEIFNRGDDSRKMVKVVRKKTDADDDNHT